MSAFFFCAACGSNLTYISGQRLKCYKCEKYFTENFVCRCPRDEGFKYSSEIVAPNKVKCHFCGREAQVPASLEPPFIDKYRGRTGSGGLGGWDGEVRQFQSPPSRPKSVKKLKQKAAKIEKPEVDCVSEDQIIIKFPGHNSLSQIRYKIVNRFLEVQSLLVDFLEKFPLPDFPVDLKVDFKNAILDIHLKSKSEQ